MKNLKKNKIFTQVNVTIKNLNLNFIQIFFKYKNSLIHWIQLNCAVATFQIHKAKYIFEVHIGECFYILLNMLKATSKYLGVVSSQISSEIFTKYL